MKKNKILIFWLGKQWYKYYNYFYRLWYDISSVTKTWINNKKLDLKDIYSFSDFKSIADSNFLNQFKYIIISVFPYFEQDKVILFIWDYKLKSVVIVEKPISDNLPIIKPLINKDNYTFFIDEVYFSFFLLKETEINKINIFVNKTDKDILEHSLWCFLLRKDFLYLLPKINIKIIENNSYDNDILYFRINILLKKDKSINITCDKGLYYFDNYWYFKCIFEDSLNSLLKLNNNLNTLYKKNVFIMQKYLNEKN